MGCVTSDKWPLAGYQWLYRPFGQHITHYTQHTAAQSQSHIRHVIEIHDVRGENSALSAILGFFSTSVNAITIIPNNLREWQMKFIIRKDTYCIMRSKRFKQKKIYLSSFWSQWHPKLGYVVRLKGVAYEQHHLRRYDRMSAGENFVLSVVLDVVHSQFSKCNFPIIRNIVQFE